MDRSLEVSDLNLDISLDLHQQTSVTLSGSQTSLKRILALLSLGLSPRSTRLAHFRTADEHNLRVHYLWSETN